MVPVTCTGAGYEVTGLNGGVYDALATSAVVAPTTVIVTYTCDPRGDWRGWSEGEAAWPAEEGCSGDGEQIQRRKEESRG